MQRPVDEDDAGVGLFVEDARASVPLWTRTFRWALADRTAIAQAWELLSYLRGRLTSLWLPTWQADLSLTADVGAADPTITIQSIGYSARLFPSECRKHIAFAEPAKAVTVRRVTAAVDNGDGTETLTLESATGVAYTAAYAFVMFCVLARLAEDSALVQWHTGSVAELELHFTEVPAEIGA